MRRLLFWPKCAEFCRFAIVMNRSSSIISRASGKFAVYKANNNNIWRIRKQKIGVASARMNANHFFLILSLHKQMKYSYFFPLSRDTQQKCQWHRRNQINLQMDAIEPRKMRCRRMCHHTVRTASFSTQASIGYDYLFRWLLLLLCRNLFDGVQQNLSKQRRCDNVTLLLTIVKFHL